MILVFVGAGASHAIDPEMYPTTVGFLQALPDEIKSHPCFKAANAYLESLPSFSPPADIEVVLDKIEELQFYCSQSFSKSSFAGWMLRQTESPRRQSERGPPERYLIDAFSTKPFDPSQLSAFQNRMRELSSVLNGLRDTIHRRVFDVYATEYSGGRVASWYHLLGSLVSGYRGLEIFTTNYDLVLEQMILDNQHIVNQVPDSMEMALGRRFDGKKAWLDFNFWNPDFVLPEGNRVRLTKLHGSVDWQWENLAAVSSDASMDSDEASLEEKRDLQSSDRKIIVSNTGHSGSDQNHVILYPGHKGEANVKPFDVFHDHLKRVVEEAQAAIFIGYAFRDEHINEILSGLSTGIPLYVIDKDERPPRQAFLQGAIHMKQGFTFETVESCIEKLKEQNLIFENAT